MQACPNSSQEPKNLAYLAINTTCALTNLYFAPYAYILSFAVGTSVGLGIGLKRRIDILIIDYNQKAARAVQDKVSHATSDWQVGINVHARKIGETPTFKSAKEIANKFSPFVRPLISFYLFISGYGKIIQKTSSYLTGFDEQRLKVIKSLNPIPGIKGTVVSVGALAANIGYLTLPILSKMWIISGFTPGYALGFASCVTIIFDGCEAHSIPKL